MKLEIQPKKLLFLQVKCSHLLPTETNFTSSDVIVCDFPYMTSGKSYLLKAEIRPERFTALHGMCQYQLLAQWLQTSHHQHLAPQAMQAEKLLLLLLSDSKNPNQPNSKKLPVPGNRHDSRCQNSATLHREAYVVQTISPTRKRYENISHVSILFQSN